MKKNLLLIIAILAAVVANAANVEKRYRKIIEKYDIADEAKAVPDTCSVADFWNAVISNNELFLRFCADIRKNKGAEKEALRLTRQLPRFYPQYDETVIRSRQGYCDSLLADMGISGIAENCALYIVSSPEPRSFTALTDDGFAICVSSALLSHTGSTRDIIMGYVAHEFVHGAMLHHLRTYYDQARRKRKANLLGGLLSVGVVGVVAVAEAVDPAPSNGDIYINDSGNTNVTVIRHAEAPAPRFLFSYDTDLEYEADLVAFRLMQRLGKAPAYLDGLRILASSSDDSLRSRTNLPPAGERIAFLTFVSRNPDLGNTRNASLRRKRMRDAS